MLIKRAESHDRSTTDPITGFAAVEARELPPLKPPNCAVAKEHEEARTSDDSRPTLKKDGSGGGGGGEGTLVKAGEGMLWAFSLVVAGVVGGVKDVMEGATDVITEAMTGEAEVVAAAAPDMS